MTKNNKEEWYYLDGLSVVGPIDFSRLQDLVVNGQLSRDVQVCQPGWSSWRTFLEASEFLGTMPRRLSRPRRFPVGGKGRVFFHDHENLVQAVPIDISRTGLFVHSPSFQIPPSRNIVATVKIPQLGRPFNVTGRVARVATTPNGQIGYALAFDNLPPPLKLLPDERDFMTELALFPHSLPK